MRELLVTGIVVLGVSAAAPGLRADPAKVQACALVTVDEISAAIGDKVGGQHETDTVVANGPAKGQPLVGCMWKAGGQGIVTVNVMPAATGAARAAGLAKLHETGEKLKKQGWTENKQSFGPSITCATLTPPPAQQQVPSVVACFGEAKGMALSVGSMSPGGKLPVGNMKALFDKAAARLP